MIVTFQGHLGGAEVTADA